MQSLQAITDIVKDEFKEVNKLISSALHSQIPMVNTISDHITGAGGKRLRPLVVLLCAKACGYNQSDHHHLTLATIIEFIHTATLLHDDVVDESALRRGEKTTNALWGNQAAVLVGDFLYSRAFQLMVSIGDLSIMKVMADATNTIAEGEVLQLVHIKNPETTEAHYFNVIEYKTAKLFEAAARVAGIISEQSSNMIETLGQFGHHLGTAYQLVDDIIDYQASTETMGKNCGDDLAEGKPTLPLIYLLQHGTQSEKALIKKVIEEGGREYFDEVRHIVTSSQALSYTQNKALEHAQKAAFCLNELPNSIYRDKAQHLIDFVTKRHF